MSDKAQKSSKERRSKKDETKENKRTHKDQGTKEEINKKISKKEAVTDSEKVKSSDKERSIREKSRVKEIKEGSKRQSSSERSGSESRRSSKDVKEKRSGQTMSTKSSMKHSDRSEEEKKAEGRHEGKRRERHEEKKRESQGEKSKAEKSREKKDTRLREERVEKKRSEEKSSDRDDEERKKENVANSDEDEKVKQREQDMFNVIEKAELKEEENNEDADDQYNYDDDDFDDYDDDFDSDVDVDMSGGSEDETDDEFSNEISTKNVPVQSLSDVHRLQIKEAMAIENARVSSNTPPLPSSPANTPVPLEESKDELIRAKSKRGLDFAGAQKTQIVNKAMSKSVKRGHDLLKIIELDVVQFDLLELKPQTEYVMYMKCFGRTDAHQVYTQYNEDYLDKEMMTEGTDVKRSWTQHPVEGAHSSGVEGENVEDNDVSLSYNPLTLAKFITLSTHIIENLLEERASRSGYIQTFKPVEKKSTFSETSATFVAKAFASSRVPMFLYPISAQTFLVTYSKPRDQTILDYPGMTCLWTLHNVDEPVQVLVSNSVHRCSCLSPYNTAIVFAGSEDGSISLWDLNEPQSMHKTINNQTLVMRLPTYNSTGIQMADSHNSKITSLQPLKFEHSQDQSHISSFQIASLDELGMIIIWVVVEVTDTSFSGSQTDLGLRPGGKIKLVKSASISVCYPVLDFDVLPEIRTFAFHQHFINTSTFFVSTDQGSVLKASRNKNVSQPIFYGHEYCIPSIIGSIDFNHFNCKYFLTGSSNGSVSFYHTNRSRPLVSWDRTTRGRPVRSVKWSQFSSTIFYVMDAANKFYFWDLSIRDSTPLLIESFDSKGLLGFTELSKTNSTGCPVIVFCFKDGSLEAHQVKAEAMNDNINNISKFESYLNTVL